ncbi:phage antirepressor [Actinophytocola sp.]|uniref:phage antirepressor n=1 Tax=Actinophytocola sp. TaxID=1872138 RepID=UPI002D7FC542|nr:phage antirepressor KilAC domain-containing protein [Actinophytocola sp.]HET9139559.1 phage antirepressor KilAC domain-containing protein [Actinophytocola sp.]
MTDDAVTETPHLTQSFIFADLDQEIRVATLDDEPWFVTADVAAAIGSGSLDARYVDAELAALGEQDRRLLPQPVGPDLLLISEPALYRLVLGSSHGLARAFLLWITHEVVPAVRRGTPGGIGRLGRRELAQMVIDAEDARERSQARVGQLEAVAAELASKADAFDTFLETDGTYSMGAVANMLGIGRNNLFKRLREAKILQADNRPYQRYAHHFRVTAGAHEQSGRDVAHHTTQVHASGVDFIRRRLNTVGQPAFAG